MLARNLVFVATLLALTAALSAARGQAPAAALSGHVTAPEGDALEGVLVSAQREGSPISITVVTDQNGAFSFPHAKLATGHYALRIRAEGYELAGPQAVEPLLRYPAMRPHPVAAQPAGRRQLERAGKPAVIGQEKEPLGIEVEPADADQPRQPLRQRCEHCWPAARIGMAGEKPARLVIEEQPGALARRQRAAVDHDAVLRSHIERR